MNNNNEKVITGTEWLIGLLILGVMFASSAWAWGQIPADAQLPIHWGADGEVDGYGSKFEVLLFTPLITIGLMVLLGFLPNIEPRRENLEMSAKAYRASFIGMVLFMCGAHSTLIAIALGHNANIMNLTISLGSGILFLVLGNYMGKVRSNHFFGIRTPWTLASDLSWDKTHRLGGKVMMALGALTILTIFMPPLAFLWVVLGGIILMTVMAMAYSYYVWRNDPHVERM